MWVTLCNTLFHVFHNTHEASGCVYCQYLCLWVTFHKTCRSLVLIRGCWQRSADLLSLSKIRNVNTMEQLRQDFTWRRQTKWWREDFRAMLRCKSIQKWGSRQCSSPEMAPARKRNQWGYKNMWWVLLSPPGVFGGVEAGHVFIFFDDIHLFTGPTKQTKSYND